MAIVIVPTPMQQLTGGQRKVEVDGQTLGECLDRLEDLYPGVRERLVDEAGEIQPHINIFVSGEDARTLQDLHTRVRPDDEIMIVPAVGGG